MRLFLKTSSLAVFLYFAFSIVKHLLAKPESMFLAGLIKAMLLLLLAWIALVEASFLAFSFVLVIEILFLIEEYGLLAFVLCFEISSVTTMVCCTTL